MAESIESALRRTSRAIKLFRDELNNKTQDGITIEERTGVRDELPATDRHFIPQLAILFNNELLGGVEYRARSSYTGWSAAFVTRPSKREPGTIMVTHGVRFATLARLAREAAETPLGEMAEYFRLHKLIATMARGVRPAAVEAMGSLGDMTVRQFLLEHEDDIANQSSSRSLQEALETAMRSMEIEQRGDRDLQAAKSRFEALHRKYGDQK